MWGVSSVSACDAIKSLDLDDPAERDRFLGALEALSALWTGLACNALPQYPETLQALLLNPNWLQDLPLPRAALRLLLQHPVAGGPSELHLALRVLRKRGKPATDELKSGHPALLYFENFTRRLPHHQSVFWAVQQWLLMLNSSHSKSLRLPEYEPRYTWPLRKVMAFLPSRLILEAIERLLHDNRDVQTLQMVAYLAGYLPNDAATVVEILRRAHVRLAENLRSGLIPRHGVLVLRELVWSMARQYDECALRLIKKEFTELGNLEVPLASRYHGHDPHLARILYELRIDAPQSPREDFLRNVHKIEYDLLKKWFDGGTRRQSLSEASGGRAYLRLS